MADLKAGFYNAVLVDSVPDRTYNATDINEHLKGLVSDDGIYATISDACQVTTGTGMNVVVKTGRGKINNHWFEIESDTTLTIDAADVVLNRIDSIVVKHSDTDRKITLEVKKGTLATNPIAPELTRTESEYEICLANVLVNKNVTAITTSMITDTRPNNEVCGWITGLINQIDTTTLFNQYEAAQNDFINNKTEEYNTWEETQQNTFDTWFEGVKQDVESTSLYREYQAVYRSNIKGQSVIDIPTSINYSNNGLDVLNVFINGMRLLKDVEYTINSNGTSITLTTPLDVATQDVEFVNKKSVSGTVAESVVVQVEKIQATVDDLSSCSYVATGTDDNIAISNIVKNFLNGTEDYSGVADNASMKINVSGSLKCDNLIEEQMVFDFNSTVTSNRRITIDFGNSTINIPASPTTKQNIFAVFSCEGDVTIENANIKIENYNATTIYGFHGGSLKCCKLIIDSSNATTIYGAWGCRWISDSNINTFSATNNYAVYQCNQCNSNIINSGTYTLYSSSGIFIGNMLSGEKNLTGTSIDLGNFLGIG